MFPMKITPISSQKKGTSNEAVIMREFTQRGLPSHAIKPRENVLTSSAWRERGHIIEHGEQGVAIRTFIALRRKNKITGADEEVLCPRTVFVFHISQTRKPT